MNKFPTKIFRFINGDDVIAGFENGLFCYTLHYPVKAGSYWDQISGMTKIVLMDWMPYSPADKRKVKKSNIMMIETPEKRLIKNYELAVMSKLADNCPDNIPSYKDLPIETKNSLSNMLMNTKPDIIQ